MMALDTSPFNLKTIIVRFLCKIVRMKGGIYMSTEGGN